MADPLLSRQLDHLSLADEYELRARTHRELDDGAPDAKVQDEVKPQVNERPKRPRQSNAFTTPPEDIVEKAHSLTSNKSELKTLLKYISISGRQTKRRQDELKQRDARKRAEEEEARRKEAAERRKLRIVQKVDSAYRQKTEELMGSRDMMRYADEAGRLSRADMGTLIPQPGIDRPIGWLNDNIINEYLIKVADTQLQEQGYKKKTKQVPRVHAFGSQFFKSWERSGFDSVKRWFTRAELDGDKILQCRMILIPVCRGNHWTLLAVSGTDKTIQYFNSMGGYGSDTYFSNKAKEMLASLLGDRYVESEWKVLPCTESNQQFNGSDCGVFASLNGHALFTGKIPKEVVSMDNEEESRGARSFMAAVLLGQAPVAASKP